MPILSFAPRVRTKHLRVIAVVPKLMNLSRENIPHDNLAYRIVVSARIQTSGRRPLDVQDDGTGCVKSTSLTFSHDSVANEAGT